MNNKHSTFSNFHGSKKLQLKPQRIDNLMERDTSFVFYGSITNRPEVTSLNT
jgi:membrane-bound lytic murein transglycosylase